MSVGRRVLAPALVVPDEQTWTVLGLDPAALGTEPAFEARVARRLLVPEHISRALVEPLREWLSLLDASVSTETHALALPGDVVAAAAAVRRGRADQGNAGQQHDTGRQGGDAHGEHGGAGKDHGDMMSIVGEPSGDGLVMEPIELTFGPLGAPLPGGLAVVVTLDGDVVAEAVVHARLRLEQGTAGVPSPPDALAPVAWRAAIAAASGPAGDDARSARTAPRAAVELERALSHLAWLRSFARALGWQLLVDRCTRAVALVLDARRLVPPDPVSPTAAAEEIVARVGAAQIAVEAVRRVARRNRWLGARAGGRGVLTASQIRAAGLRGPLARASGLADDARVGDPFYARLGFQPVVRSEGDALARTLVRVDEAAQSLRLAASILSDAGTGADERPAAVEGPRGPLRAERLSDGWVFSAPGSWEARAAAGEAMIGLEWATALVVLSSFDLSPWAVGA